MTLIKKHFYKKGKIYCRNHNNIDLQQIQNFYEHNPFPNYEENEDIVSIKKKGDNNPIINQIKKKFRFNQNILELGSGTSQMSIYLALGTNNKIFALDGNLSSLQLAENFITENNINNVKLINADLFDNNFEKESFDLVWSSGVLHHTKDPKKGFFKMVDYLKKDGYLILGLYNKYFRIETQIRKQLYRIFGKKILFYFDPVLKKSKFSDQQIKAWINDQYEHPLESVHTYGEVIEWFDEKNIEIINFYPNFDDYRKLDLFKKNKNDIRNPINRSLLQLSNFFTNYSADGGLFIFIGKKNG